MKDLCAAFDQEGKEAILNVQHEQSLTGQELPLTHGQLEVAGVLVPRQKLAIIIRVLLIDAVENHGVLVQEYGDHGLGDEGELCVGGIDAGKGARMMASP